MPLNSLDHKLINAVRNDNLIEALQCLDAGANVNVRTLPSQHENECTSLHIAAYNGLKTMATLLLEHGANRDMLTATHNCSPATLANDYGYPAFGSFIKNWQMGQTDITAQIRSRLQQPPPPASIYFNLLEPNAGFASAAACLAVAFYFMSFEKNDSFQITSLLLAVAVCYFLGKKAGIFTNDGFELVKTFFNKLGEGIKRHGVAPRIDVQPNAVTVQSGAVQSNVNVQPNAISVQPGAIHAPVRVTDNYGINGIRCNII